MLFLSLALFVVISYVEVTPCFLVSKSNGFGGLYNLAILHIQRNEYGNAPTGIIHIINTKIIPRNDTSKNPIFPKIQTFLLYSQFKTFSTHVQEPSGT